jgi:hypothetical protein
MDAWTDMTNITGPFCDYVHTRKNMAKRVITGNCQTDTDMQNGRPCNSFKNADNVSYLGNKISYSTKIQ